MTRFDGLLPTEVVVAEASPAMWDSGLLPDEEAYVKNAVAKRRREFTAGRNCARQALGQAGFSPSSIRVGDHREPLFPNGASGTITHTNYYCAAAVVRIGEIVSIGIDAEEAASLDPRYLEFICAQSERDLCNRLPSHIRCWDRVLFCCKEAFYKAYFQLSRHYLDMREVSVAIDPFNESFSVKILKHDADIPVRTGQLKGAFACNQQMVRAAMSVPRLACL
jgi:4'-phosphopantetheinyl transferase EntD